MSWKRNIKHTLSNVFSLYNIISGPRTGFRILMYHSISKGVQDDPDGIFTVTKNLFSNHMDILENDKKLNLVSLEQGVNNIDKKLIKVSVTFDDGFADNLYVVAPIMLKQQIPFTVFVVSDFVKNNVEEYLNRKELYELSQFPRVTIGSHGASHTPLNQLNDYQLKEELSSSKKYIEDITGKLVNAISFPHGAIDSRIKDYAINAGYSIGGTSRFNINKNHQDPIFLARNVILSYDNEKIFKQKLYGSCDWYSLISS